MTASPGLGIVGTGPIALAHAKAATSAGFKIRAVLYKSNQIGARAIESLYPSAVVTNSKEKFFEIGFDAVVNATPPDANIDFISELAELEIPALLEKPVSLDANRLRELSTAKNLYVSLNRRFYPSVREWHSLNQAHKPSFVEFLITEPSASGDLWSLFKYDGVHIADLALWTLPALKDVLPIATSSSLLTKSALFGLDGMTVSFNLFLDAPVNHSASSISATGLAQLKPIEEYKQFKGFAVDDTNDAYRKYAPICTRSVAPEPNLVHKLGFLEQSLEFASIVSGNRSQNLGKVDDIYNAFSLLDKIILSHELVVK